MYNGDSLCAGVFPDAYLASYALCRSARRGRLRPTAVMFAGVRHRRHTIVGCVVAGLLGASGAGAVTRPGLAHVPSPSMVRASVNDAGIEVDAPILPDIDISEDGRYVVFSTAASTLLPWPRPPSATRVFLRDIQAQTTVLVSRNSNGFPGLGVSDMPSVSADGRLVAFRSTAALTPDDTNGAIPDVYVYATTPGTVGTPTLVSRNASGVVGNGASGEPTISNDGRFVVFSSSATNLVSGDALGEADVFISDLQAGSLERVSVGMAGTEANDGSGEPAVSSDGRYVVFSSDATNLVPVDDNRSRDVFLVDRRTGLVERESQFDAHLFRPSEIDGGSGYPSISSDGRYVAFESLGDLSFAASGGDNNGTWDVVRRDRASQTLTVVTDSGRGTTCGASRHPQISADGHHVAFESDSELVYWDYNRQTDVYTVELGPTRSDPLIVSMLGGILGGNGPSSRPAVDATGSRVAFTTEATNLVPTDTNSVTDVIVSGEHLSGPTAPVPELGSPLPDPPEQPPCP
jgi:Tol biopolymer transport system component